MTGNCITLKTVSLSLYACVEKRETCRQEWFQLVDPASVYMLVSKTKPCMSKYNLVLAITLRETANGSLNQLWSKGVKDCKMDTCGKSRANTYY